MSDALKFPADFPITSKWPAQNPNVIQLYSLPTPNGIKVSAMLEETGLAYEAHLVSFATSDQTTPEFLSLNPNNKIPAIIDPNGPGGAPMGLWESGAILLYLAEKSGKMLPTDPAERHQAVQWLMWQMGGLGPMFGQLGFFFKMGGKDMEDKLPLNRYTDEAKRLLSVLDKHLEGKTWLVGETYSVADLAIWPWIRTIGGFYGAGDQVGLDSYKNVMRWTDVAADRPASKKAVSIPPRD